MIGVYKGKVECIILLICIRIIFAETSTSTFHLLLLFYTDPIEQDKYLTRPFTHSIEFERDYQTLMSG